MKELPLSRGRVALVDDDVWEWASGHRWYVHPQGYVYRKSSLPNGKRGTSLLRREIMQPPPGAEVAHRNEDQLDHRRENLVVFTPAERAAHKAVRIHREGLRATNTSGFRGVSCGRGRRGWVAKIRVAGNLRHLGRFPTPEAAARAWDRAAREAWGPLAYQNFPSGGGGDSRSDDGINSPVNVI